MATARDVASADASEFIKFVPIRMTVRSASILFLSPAATFAFFCFSCTIRRIFIFESERYAVSEPAKNPMMRMMTIRTASIMTDFMLFIIVRRFRSFFHRNSFYAAHIHRLNRKYKAFCRYAVIRNCKPPELFHNPAAERFIYV